MNFIRRITSPLYLRRFYRNTPKPVSQAKNPLTHKTFQSLWSTKISPSGNGPADSFSTHVIDKKTGKPVEVFVKLSETTKLPFERYVFYIADSSSQEPNFIEIGYRSFDINDTSRKITPGGMENSNKSRYAGLGIRGHQIAIERMINYNLSNVELYSLTQAYPFHKGCGFEAFSESFISLEKRDPKDILQIWSNIFHVDIDIAKGLAVIRKDKDLGYILDKDLTIRNITEYCINNSITLPSTLGMSMNLTPKAINAWKELISKQPIILGK